MGKGVVFIDVLEFFVRFLVKLEVLYVIALATYQTQIHWTG